jgi:hypothetical protein
MDEDAYLELLQKIIPSNEKLLHTKSSAMYFGSWKIAKTIKI